MSGAPELPPPVRAPFSETVRQYWLDRVRQHEHDFYAGLPLSKFPEDLRVYEHLMWAACPDVVIEIGTQHGASALWLRDRLRTMVAYGRVRDPRVISIDLDMAVARENLARVDPGYGATIELVEADVLDPALPERIAALVREGAPCMVIEDSAHVYDTTMAALRGFARFVPPDGFFVVEDGCVDVEEMRARPDWPRGVLPAVRDWLATTDEAWEQARDLELYGITCHPGGFLRRLCLS